MYNIFIIGTCRVHKPFGYENSPKKPTNYDCYNVLNMWGSYNFLGPKFNVKEIYQFLNILTDNNSPLLKLIDKNIKDIFKDCYIDDNNFQKQIEDTYNKFKIADIVIIEISSIKDLQTIINNTEISINLFKHDLANLENYQYNIIGEYEFIKYLNYIREIMNKYNKKVLFVSHFNYANIKNREFIYNVLKNNLPENILFNPSKIIINNLPHSIVDPDHYSKDMEVLIMDELHNYITKL
jgi:hypothetical protein